MPRETYGAGPGPADGQDTLRGHRLVGYVQTSAISPGLDYGRRVLAGLAGGVFGVVRRWGQVAAVALEAPGIGILHLPSSPGRMRIWCPLRLRHPIRRCLLAGLSRIHAAPRHIQAVAGVRAARCRKGTLGLVCLNLPEGAFRTTKSAGRLCWEPSSRPAFFQQFLDGRLRHRHGAADIGAVGLGVERFRT